MVIGIDASRANLERRTGTEWYSFYLIKELAKLDKENKYILYLDKEPKLDLQEIIRDKDNFSFKVLKWPWPFFWTLGRFSLEMLFRAPDILFVPAHAIPFFSPKKTITTIHDIAFVEDGKLYRQEKIKLSYFFRKLVCLIVKIFTLGKYKATSLDYLTWSTKRALKKAKTIITVSNFTKQEILRHYGNKYENKIKVVHNGYNNELYKEVKDEEKTKQILAKYGLETPYFLYVGRLEKKKNTPLLLEALAIARENRPDLNLKLALVGSASYGFDEVKYVIEQFNLTRQIYISGWIAEEDMPYIFSATTAFIFPTKYEGFGIPILQAMACQVPVIASDLEVLREVAQDAALFFDVNSPTQLADYLINISDNLDLRKELIDRGKERVKNYSWQKTAQESYKLLQNL